jgi:hypothetical protein
MLHIQGYIPTILPKGDYAAFHGGRTGEWNEAYCASTAEEAIRLSRKQCKRHELPYATPCGADAKPCHTITLVQG